MKKMRFFIVLMAILFSIVKVNGLAAESDDIEYSDSLSEEIENPEENVEGENDTDDIEVPEDSYQEEVIDEEVIDEEGTEQEKSSAQEEEFEIPQVVGLSEDEARNAMANSDAEIIYRYVIDNEAENGIVLNQYIDDEGNIVVEIAQNDMETDKTEGLFNITNSFALAKMKSDAPSIVNSTWDDNYSYSYEFNWDNSQSCWYWGYWEGGLQNYKTPEGEYDSNVRHRMGLYCDGQNVHLFIEFARVYGTKINGNDYNFYFDGEPAKFNVVYSDNNAPITGNLREPGYYNITVINENNSISSYEAMGAHGTLWVKEDNINDELELIIPLEVFKEQNPNINIDNFSVVEYYNPNLMYRRIACAGADTAPWVFAGFSVAFWSIGLGILMRKKAGEGQGEAAYDKNQA